MVRSALFSQGLFGDLILQEGFGQQLLQPSILGFQLLQALGVRETHPAKLAAPEVLTRFREGMLAAQLHNRHPGLRFLQEADDLLFSESLLHVQSPC